LINCIAVITAVNIVETRPCLTPSLLVQTVLIMSFFRHHDRTYRSLGAMPSDAALY